VANEKPVAVHRGETISFEEYDDTWRWNDCSNMSIKKVKEYIDRAHKETLNGQSAYTFPAWRAERFQKVTVTSCTDDNSHYWVKNGRGKREKVKVGALLADCPENELKIAEIASLDTQIAALTESKRRTEESLIRFGGKANDGAA
jgi:hypothetical protein